MTTQTLTRLHKRQNYKIRFFTPEAEYEESWFETLIAFGWVLFLIALLVSI